MFCHQPRHHQILNHSHRLLLILPTNRKSILLLRLLHLHLHRRQPRYFKLLHLLNTSPISNCCILYELKKRLVCHHPLLHLPKEMLIHLHHPLCQQRKSPVCNLLNKTQISYQHPLLQVKISLIHNRHIHHHLSKAPGHLSLLCHRVHPLHSYLQDRGSYHSLHRRHLNIPPHRHRLLIKTSLVHQINLFLLRHHSLLLVLNRHYILQEQVNLCCLLHQLLVIHLLKTPPSNQIHQGQMGLQSPS